VICSTEKRFLFTAHSPGPTGRIMPQHSLSSGPKNPEPLNQFDQHPPGSTSNFEDGIPVLPAHSLENSTSALRVLYKQIIDLCPFVPGGHTPTISHLSAFISALLQPSESA